MEAGFFLVPDTNAVSNGTLLFTSIPVKKLKSIIDKGSLFSIFLNSAPDKRVDICVSNITASLCFQGLLAVTVIIGLGNSRKSGFDTFGKGDIFVPKTSSWSIAL